jgi:hypothetical protein
VFYKAFIEAYNVVVENKEYFMAKWKEQLESEDVLIRITAKNFIGFFKEAETINEFNVEFFFNLVEKITVWNVEILMISFLDGSEIKSITEKYNQSK